MNSGKGTPFSLPRGYFKGRRVSSSLAQLCFPPQLALGPPVSELPTPNLGHDLFVSKDCVLLTPRARTIMEQVSANSECVK